MRAAAVLSVVAASIHLWVMPEHFREWWGYGAFFLVCAAAQVLYAAALLRRAGRRLFLLGIAGNLAIVVLWVVSRTIGVPLGPGAGEQEAVGALDVAASAAELALVLALWSLLVRAGRPSDRESSAYLLAVAGIAVVLSLLGGLTPGTNHRMSMSPRGHTARHDTSVCRPPTSDSPDAGFTRDMIVHHAQAVEMSEITRDRTKDPQIRNLADEIVLTQQQQVGEMQGWLQAWGLPDTGHEKPMAWMGHPIEHGRMPGMASSKDIIGLREEPPKQMDVQFLRLIATTRPRCPWPRP